ncbi:hypothetical protein ACFPZL_05020 [Leucobacter soli]|uniref:Uncharacterized protein n=1 Tax=Leucobacter soli TaxID=2812850 RepID=A0A916NGE8_9MICO|nr:hypothetical protein [Leucobacter soli]CAG7607007.1 hypothetical protein LEUCIP111803_00980 [Leucobacter soli]
MTTTTGLDRLLFGDNQFFGVNHMSEEKARAQAVRFQDLSAMMDVLDAAQAEGIHSFMCTTHERIAEVADRVRADRVRYASFAFLPCMPYAHKYANAMTELGPLGALKSFLPADQSLVGLALQGGAAVAKKDVESLIRMLIDAEMTMFDGVPTPVVFLQNVVVDLLLGLGFDDAFTVFAEHVRSRYGAEPGFITMNLPRLLDALDRVGLERPLVCSNLNKLGFRMSGGAEEYERALAERDFRAVAMSVYASGAIPPREAFDWVVAHPRIESVVFGASSAANIRGTIRAAREAGFLPEGRA